VSLGRASALLLGLLLALPAWATPVVGLRQALLAVESPAAAAQRGEAFVEVDAARLRLDPVDGAERLWLKVPAQAQAGVVELERVPLDAITGWLGEGASAAEFSDAFFQPPPGEALRSRYVVPLPAGTPLWLALSPTTPSEVSLRWRSERDSLIAGRNASNLAAASYAAILATALASLALTLAVRESAFRYFTAFAASVGLFLGLASGHAFELPLLGSALGGLGLRPLLLAGGLLALSGLLFANGLLGLDTREVPLARWVERLALALGALGLLLALLPAPLLRVLLPWWAGLVTLAFLLPVGIAAWSWSLGARIAGVLCVLWSGVLLVVAAQWAVSVGWLPPLDSLRWLQQFGGAAAVVALSVTLTDRVIVLRREAERLQALHAESSASLQIEQQRRRFLEGLRDAAASAVAAGDLEWKAFRLLLQTLDELLPGRLVALTVTGYRGFDYLLAEPMSAKPRLCALLGERSATLKGICRSRHAMQAELEVPGGEAAQFAVVPVNVPRPGWGALLIERERGSLFAPAELATASDFVEAALEAIEEGAHKAALRRTAEVDPLTGLTNRRTGETRLETLMRAAQLAHRPLALLFIDFDLFRTLNERHGIAVGDQCLRAVADALRGLLGADDVLVRYGGDEFLLVLPEQDAEAARAVAERVRAQVASLRVRSEQGPLKVTVSVGVAAMASAGDLPERLIARAERAAGSAKGSGRNQVALAAAFGAQGEAPAKPPIF
jgi:diguanylate cyclase (GGDEF)-like protein